MHDRISGGLLGLLVGDALGVPYEFHVPESLPPRDEIEMTPPPGFSRSHRGVPPGTWSDDGAHALILLDSLLRCNRLDLDDLGRHLVRWHAEGYMTPDGNVFDIGNQTSVALSALRSGVPARSAGPKGEGNNGNGALMRVLPLVLWHRGSDAELLRDAMEQSLVTHGHIRSQLCCALYTLWARRTLQQATDPWSSAVAFVRETFATGTPERDELDRVIDPDGEPVPLGKGYVLDTLRSARWAVAQGSYETVVKAAISLGHDTDTTACVAGGIAGLRDGVEAIPERWRSALRGMHLVAPMLERLVGLHSTRSTSPIDR